MADDERKLVGETVGGSSMDDEFSRFLRTPQFTSIIESSYPSLSPSTVVTAVPVGAVLPYAGSEAPDGWLMCDGSAVDARRYPELSRLIGSNTPDLRGRAPVGAGKDGSARNNVERTLHTSGGDTRSQAHSHSIRTANASYAIWHDFIGGGADPIVNLRANVTAQSGAYSGEWQAVTSGSGDQDNMPPFYVLNFIIKAR